MTDLGVQLYSVREAMAADPHGVLIRLADIGFRTVEPVYGLMGGDPPGFRRLLDANGLTAPSLHAPVLGAAREEIAQAAHAIGAQTVVVPLIPEAEFTTAAAVTRTAERLAEAASWLESRGLSLAYHNHHWELEQRPAGHPALELLARLLPPQVALEVDVYWAQVGGVDVSALLDRLGDRVRLIHIKDGPAVKGEAMTAVGTGVLPMREILDAAPPQALRIVELDRCDGDMFTALKDSFTYLNEAR